MEIKVRLAKDLGFPINEKLAGLVPMATEAEQEALTEDIRKHEQREPIVLWHGEVVDGRCRQKALLALGKHILYKELDDELTEDEVRVFVKSVNTRRNLTMTQKIMSAAKSYLSEHNTNTMLGMAKSWGVSHGALKNGIYLFRNYPEIANNLFNGFKVNIATADGKEIATNKVTAVYAYLKKAEEAVTEDIQHGWKPDSYIKTQAGKEWYYSTLEYSKDPIRIQMLLAELANYKFENGLS